MFGGVGRRTANDAEQRREREIRVDPVEEFAAWLRHLHREAKKPSYTEIVRRIRLTDPTASVVVSTISETLNGKRLPRWTTVEPIARVLGGPPAVEECLRRWKQADAARTPTAPPTSAVPVPDGLASGLETEGAGTGAMTGRPSTAASGHAEVADPGGRASGDEAPVHTARRRRKPPPLMWVVSTVTALGVAAAAWAAAGLFDDRNQKTSTGGPTAGTSTAPDTRPTGRTPSADGTEAGAPEATVQPPFKRGTYETVLTVNEETWTSPDGNVRIRVPGASTSDGPDLFVTTPTVSCPQTTVAIGDALIVPEISGSSWTRITTLKVWAQDTPNGEPFDMYAQLQVDQGTGRAPQGKRCAS
ncbi:MAG TPA: helix-turn-helix transcriptional regulator [Streptomyces sp.]|uniref:helix-turn-helix domain-containing protein n=1 Tax=Streptomyces sp. TaxID=1931 RepID=UPI002B561041|nr:helix-turn-helix transcriptional regulator [Streptomyces sp.]HWU10536.1 helix-turn-helix transcriptional regulator [Streptomyces sp.]